MIGYKPRVHNQGCNSLFRHFPLLNFHNPHQNRVLGLQTINSERCILIQNQIHVNMLYRLPDSVADRNQIFIRHAMFHVTGVPDVNSFEMFQYYVTLL